MRRLQRLTKLRAPRTCRTKAAQRPKRKTLGPKSAGPARAAQKRLRRSGLRLHVPPPKVHPPATAYHRGRQKERDRQAMEEEGSE